MSLSFWPPLRRNRRNAWWNVHKGLVQPPTHGTGSGLHARLLWCQTGVAKEILYYEICLKYSTTTPRPTPPQSLVQRTLLHTRRLKGENLNIQQCHHKTPLFYLLSQFDPINISTALTSVLVIYSYTVMYSQFTDSHLVSTLRMDGAVPSLLCNQLIPCAMNFMLPICAIR